MFGSGDTERRLRILEVQIDRLERADIKRSSERDTEKWKQVEEIHFLKERISHLERRHDHDTVHLALNPEDV